MDLRVYHCFALLLSLANGMNLALHVNGPSADTAVKTNGSATLKCRSQITDSSVSWYTGSPFSSLEALIAADDPHYTSLQSDGGAGSSLTVTEYKNHRHGGDYTCRIASDSSTNVLYSCPGSLSHARITPGFIEEPSDISVPVGTIAILKCSPPYSNPPASVAWLKNDEPLTTDDFILADSGNLYLLNVTDEDAGYYQCIASNSVTGRVRHSTKALLTVLDYSVEVEQEFIVTPQNITVPLGITFELECADNLGSEVQWSWVGHASLPPSVIDSNGVLVIFQANREMNGELFRCSVGDLTSDARVTVVAPPVVSLHVDNSSGSPGSDITVHCNDQSGLGGLVSLVWNQEGLLTPPLMIEGGGMSAFIVTLPSKGEVGIQCLLKNEYGCDMDAVLLTVDVPVVVIDPEPVSLVVTPSDDIIQLSGAPDDAVTVTCLISFVDDITLFSFGWRHDNSPAFILIHEDQMSNQAISIISVTGPGSYTCEAVLFSSEVGVEILSKTIHVVSQPTPTNKPHPSTTIVTNSLSATTSSVSTSIVKTTSSTPSPSQSPPPSVTVTVSPPRVDEVVGTDVAVTCTTGEGAIIQWEHTNQTLIDQATVQDLVVGGDVISVLSLGPLLPVHQGTLTCIVVHLSSDIINHKEIPIHVRAGIPSQSVDPVYLNWLDDSSLQVLWPRPPHEDHIKVLGYKLAWALDGTPLPQVALRAVPYHTEEYVIVGLEHTLEYRVKVWPYSIGGDGPAVVAGTTDNLITEAPTNSTEGPSVPVSKPLLTVDSCFSLHYSFGFVDVEVLDTDIVEQLVVEYVCSDAGFNGSVSTDGTTQQVTIGYLIPNCDYHVTVVGLDEEGKHVATETCDFTTSANLGDFLNFNVQWSGDLSQLSVMWHVPSLLQSLQGNVSTEIDINGHWTSMQDGQHIIDHFNPYEDNTFNVRVRIGNYVIYSSSISVPAQMPLPSTQPSQSPNLPLQTIPYVGTPWMTYGVGLAGVVLSIAAALTLVLVLKHVQTKRREKGKVIDHRRNRMASLSSQKSLFVREDSLQSIKKAPPQHTSFVLQTNVRNVYECAR